MDKFVHQILHRTELAAAFGIPKVLSKRIPFREQLAGVSPGYFSVSFRTFSTITLLPSILPVTTTLSPAKGSTFALSLTT